MGEWERDPFSRFTDARRRDSEADRILMTLIFGLLALGFCFLATVGVVAILRPDKLTVLLASLVGGV